MGRDKMQQIVNGIILLGDFLESDGTDQQKLDLARDIILGITLDLSTLFPDKVMNSSFVSVFTKRRVLKALETLEAGGNPFVSKESFDAYEELEKSQ